MTPVLRGNWNYPTTMWSGPGRIAELPAASARTLMTRPLIVTDEGLVNAPMIKSAHASLPGAAVFGALTRPSSVTISGRVMRVRAQAAGSSAMRPGPDHMVVG